MRIQWQGGLGYDTSMARRRKNSVLTILVLAVMAWFAREYLRAPQPAPAPGKGWRTVIRVVDGDTLQLDGGERVRLIGVDTPETVHPNKPVGYFGKEASAFTKRMAEGKRARLEFDVERTDRFGRTLAYVYLEDGTFLNAEIIREGYGHAETRFPFRYLEQFRAHEREAREQRRGLWAEGP
jgi:micrococcal nuclease